MEFLLHLYVFNGRSKTETVLNASLFSTFKFSENSTQMKEIIKKNKHLDFILKNLIVDVYN